MHYLVVGAARGLDPCPLFDTSAYRERNPGLGGENPLVHYLRSRRERPTVVPAPESEDVRRAKALLLEKPFGAPRAELAEGHVHVAAPDTAPGSAGEAGLTAPASDGGTRPDGVTVVRGLPAGLAHPPRAAPSTRGRVLVAGVYLVDRENHAADIAAELARSREWEVEQRWIALGESPVPDALAPVTAWRQPTRAGKFVLLNRLLAEVAAERFDLVLFADDDIVLPPAFLDRYLELVSRHDLALAQPARTHDSYTDNWIVERLDGLAARRTRFVEIGPLFSIRRDALPLLTPFDETSPMGWGYDFVWPVVIEQGGLRMGIVDATPVAHKLRKPVAFYDDRDAAVAARVYLAEHRHLSRHDAFSIVESYP